MTGRLDPPDWFPAGHRQIWSDTIARLADAGGVFRADPRVLEVYVAAYAAHAQAAQLVAQTNVLITRNGQAVENPALAVMRRTAADLAKASRALGLHREPLQSVLADSPLDRADGRRYCEIHQRKECKHRRQNGTDWCHAFQVIPGTGSCRKHVGMTYEKAREKGRVALARLYSSRLDVTPGEALLEEVRWAAGAVADLRVKVGELAEEPGPDGEPGSGLWWGVSRETDRDGVVEREFKAGPHVILQAYDRQREHLVRAASAAHSAGAVEGAVDAAKAIGAGLGRLLDAIFDVLELSEEQRAWVPVRVPPLLRQFDPDGEAG